MEKLGFGVIGCGFIGMLHAGVIAALDGAYLAAVADSDAGKTEEAVRKWGCRSYKDYHEMLQGPGCRSGFCLSAFGDAQQCHHRGSQGRKHVICEKPIDIHVERAQEMVDTCRECGVELGVIMQHRFDKPIVLLKQAAAEGKLGKLLWGASRTIWYRDEEYFSNPWRGTWEFDGGGSLMKSSPSIILTAADIFRKVKSVNGKCRRLLIRKSRQKMWG